MRRAFSAFLIAILSFPLIAQAFSLDPASNLPACCRRAGAHHCAMQGSGPDSSTQPLSGPQATQARCPLFPQPGTISQTTRLVIPAVSQPTPGAQLLGRIAPSPDQPAALRKLANNHRKRGPPPSLNSL